MVDSMWRVPHAHMTPPHLSSGATPRTPFPLPLALSLSLLDPATPWRQGGGARAARRFARQCGGEPVGSPRLTSASGSPGSPELGGPTVRCGSPAAGQTWRGSPAAGRRDGPTARRSAGLPHQGRAARQPTLRALAGIGGLVPRVFASGGGGGEPPGSPE